MGKNLPADALQSVTATINGRPVEQLCHSIYIAEDMYNTFPKSSLVIARDPRFEMQEMLAGQTVEINAKPQTGSALKVSHVVFNAQPQIAQGARGMQGVINGTSPDFQGAIQSRVTKSWKQKNTDEVIKEIHSEVLKSKLPIEVSKGFKQASFTSPSLMPMQAMDKAHSLSGAGSRAFYFQTHENGGKAHCKTLKDLTSKGPKMKLTYNAAAAANEASPGDNTIIYDLQYTGSNAATVKQTQAQGQRYNPSFGQGGVNDKSGQGNQTPGLGVKSSAAKVAFPVVNTIEQDKEKRQIDRDEQNLNNLTASIKILTNLQTDLHAGDVIEVKSGSATYFSDGSPENAASGKWLITAIMHCITMGGGETATNTGRSVIHCIGKL